MNYNTPLVDKVPSSPAFPSGFVVVRAGDISIVDSTEGKLNVLIGITGSNRGCGS